MNKQNKRHRACILQPKYVCLTPTGVQLGQWWHESRVDWLELNESGQLLLLRDTRRRLALLQLHTGDKVLSTFYLISFTVGRKWIGVIYIRTDKTQRSYSLRRSTLRSVSERVYNI